MSKNRIAMLVVLILMTVGAVVVLGYVGAERLYPDFYWHRADAAYQRKEFESARLNLQKLLKKYPQHDRGHELMAQVILAEAGADPKRSARYAANPQAVHHLSRAAELRPDDIELQKRLVRAYVQTPRNFGKAVKVAEVVHKVDPKDPDAVFILTWNAVEKRDVATAEKLFAISDASDFQTRHVFQTLQMKAKFYADADDLVEADKVLKLASEIAESLPADALEILTFRDRQAMLAILLAYQQRADDHTAGIARVEKSIKACETISSANVMDQRMVADAAAKSIALFNIRYPRIERDPGIDQALEDLTQRAEKLGAKALDTVEAAKLAREKRIQEFEQDLKEAEAKLAEAKNSFASVEEVEDRTIKVDAIKARLEGLKKQTDGAPLLVYWNTARSLMSQNKHDEAIKVLEQGLEFAEKSGITKSNDQHLDLYLLAARVLIMQRNFNEANKYLNKLDGHERFEGWSHLLKGSVALHEGRLDLAHTEFLRARQSMGDRILVRMSLARTHMAREEWVQAIEMLKTLQVNVDDLPKEEQAWHHQLLGNGKRVELDMLRAHLAMAKSDISHWNDAKQQLLGLVDTDYEAAAVGLVVVHLWEDAEPRLHQSDPRKSAMKYIEAKRANPKFSDELGLALLHARMLKESDELAKGTRVVEAFAARKPGDELAQLALARWYVRNRQPEKALATLEAVKQIEGFSTHKKARNTVAIYRVQALLSLGRAQEAKEESDDLINNPGTATAGYLFRAAIAFGERNQKEGVEYLKKARDSNPRNAKLAILYANVSKQQGDFSGVLESIADVAGISEYDGQVQATVRQAIARITKEQGPAAALAEVDKMLARRPGDLSLVKYKVELLLQQNQFVQAVAELNKAEAKAANDPRVWELKAKLHAAQAARLLSQDDKEGAAAEYAKAIAQVDRALTIDRDNPELNAVAARIKLGAGQYGAAARHAETVRVKDPSSPRGYLLLAEAYRGLGRNIDAVAALKVYAQKNPNDFAIHKTIAELYAGANNVDAGLNYLKTASIAHPGDMRYFTSELKMLLEHKRQSEAQLRASEALRNINSPVQILVVAQAFAAGDAMRDAIQWGETALTKAATNPGDRATANSFLGRVHLKQGNHEKARQHFEAVLKDKPADLVAANNLAWILSNDLGQPDEAVRVIEAGQTRNNATIDQLPLEYIDTMVVVYRNASKKQKAIDVVKQALRKYPANASLIYQLGMLMVEDDPSKAKDLLAQALKIGLPKKDETEAKRLLTRL